MQVSDQVKSAISKVLKIPIDRLQDDTRLDELGVESIDVIEIVYELEETFDINISLEASQTPSNEDGSAGKPNLPQFATIGDLCREVQRLVDSKAAK
jgi:acyl carrier protein